ncbi:DUF6896 domain-containing protein [Hymenobacter negativus]|uniref:DUF6896 domain-containing protein n=1 Tax=Hymenobacter negativus TaxID=2795026 RepID=A0ABS3QK52_9BACT|nr:hypothetical protein [Hymenobacter negativus]MBO2011638.1 hypothetical protein [Hymenobacter negativus]
MTTNFIEKNIDTFIVIIQAFTDDAKSLVKKLSQKYNLEIDDKMPANSFFKLKSQIQNGYIDKQWSYFLHGYECRFKHENGNIIDVVLTFENEYGALDPYFLGRYIRTNPKHTNVSTRIQNEFKDGLKIIKVLRENNLLLTINNQAGVIIEFENDEAIYVQQTFEGIKLKK